MKANPRAIPTPNPPSPARLLPKIGIRPVTTAVAEACVNRPRSRRWPAKAAPRRALEANLRHSRGLPVECVIADTHHWRLKEAADCAEKSAREMQKRILDSPSLVLWSETMDMDSSPRAVWGFNGNFARAPCIEAVLAAHA